MTAPILSEPVQLSGDDLRLVQSSRQALLRLIELYDSGKTNPVSHQRLSIRFEFTDGGRTEIALPEATLPILLSLLEGLGRGKTTAVVATDTEITTQQAAAFLGVSRPHVVKLLERGEIPFRNVGVRRRIRLEDILLYNARQEAIRHRGLDELAAEAQKLGIS